MGYKLVIHFPGTVGKLYIGEPTLMFSHIQCCSFRFSRKKFYPACVGEGEKGDALSQRYHSDIAAVVICHAHTAHDQRSEDVDIIMILRMASVRSIRSIVSDTLYVYSVLTQQCTVKECNLRFRLATESEPDARKGVPLEA